MASPETSSTAGSTPGSKTTLRPASWACHNLSAGHMPMFTMTNELADLLLGVAPAVEWSTHG